MRALGLLLLLAACAAPAPPVSAPPVSAPPVPTPPAWARPDLAPAWLSAAGDIRWPPEDGFRGTATPIILPPGVLLDRFGADTGRFLSPKGAAFRARALPTACATQPYSSFRVLTPLPVWIGRAAPWFDEPGGATQVQTDATVKQLLDDGVLARLPAAAAPCG